MNKIGNINIVGSLRVGDSEYTVEQLLAKLQNSGGGNVNIEHVQSLPEGSNINHSTIYVYENTFNVYNGSEWVVIGGGSGSSGDYNELINKPFIPSKLSDLTNDINAEQNIIETVKIDGVTLPVSNKSINIDLSRKADVEDVPTKTSELLNDSLYITSNDLTNLSIDWRNVTNKPSITLSGAITGSASLNGLNNINIVTALDNITINAEDIEGLSVSWNDLTDKPTIPSKYSELTNDTGLVLSDVNFSTSLNTKLTGIETGAQVNKIENIIVNGTSLDINNKTVTIDTSTVNYIMFKTPVLKQTQFAHIKIEFSKTWKFNNDDTIVFDTTDPNTYDVDESNPDDVTISDLYVFSGLSVIGFPQRGLGQEFSGEPIQLLVAKYKEYPYYRFQWLIGRVGDVDSGYAEGRYGYGSLTALMSMSDLGGEYEVRLSNLEALLNIENIEDDIDAALQEVE